MCWKLSRSGCARECATRRRRGRRVPSMRFFSSPTVSVGAHRNVSAGPRVSLCFRWNLVRCGYISDSSASGSVRTLTTMVSAAMVSEGSAGVFGARASETKVRGSLFHDGAFRVSRVSFLDNQEAKRRRARRACASSSSPARCLDVSADAGVSWTYGLPDTPRELPETSFPRRLERTDRGGSEGQARVYTPRRRAHVRDVRRAHGRRGRASRIPRRLAARACGL